MKTRVCCARRRPALKTPVFTCLAEKGKLTRASVTITASSSAAVAELFSRRAAKMASPCRNSLAERDASPSAAGADVMDSRSAAAIAVNTFVVCVDFFIRRGTTPVKSTAKYFESSAFCSADLPLRFGRLFYD